jgi:pimeloyl-ACP methyl ester carboxylesterase
MTITNEAEFVEPRYLDRPDGARLAYCRSPATKRGRHLPGLVFLGGFVSDMTGTKALALEAFAQGRGQAFLRFDYQGHGRSSGRFEDGTIGRWAEDAVAVLDQLTDGPQVLVGSSMGGWIMLLAALARPERVVGLVGIAAAPDFTEDLLWAGYPPEVRRQLERDGVYEQTSDYADQPYRITRALIEDGRKQLLLRAPIPITCPLRLIHGMADEDVPWQVSMKLSQQIQSADVELTLVKDGDHRLSGPRDLSRLDATIERLCRDLPPVTTVASSPSDPSSV